MIRLHMMKFLLITAASLCKDNDMPILVFSVNEPDNIFRAVCGENIGTICEK